MGSDKQAVECDVGLGLMTHQQQQPQQHVSSPADASALFRQVGDAYDVVSINMNTLNSDFHFKSQVPIRGPFSFTKAQWQELERQTVVYRFLSASVPVPPQLLMPINCTQANPAISHPHSLMNFGFPSNGTEQEPWRCRRTDGKKWRCSRDVAPDQKYCERHAHKNRPRSRKHVEIHFANLTSTPNISTGKKNHHLDLKASLKSVAPKAQIFGQNEPQLLPYPTLASYDQSRCSFNWFSKGNTTLADSASQKWQPKEEFMGSQSGNLFKDVSTFYKQKETPMSSDSLNLFLDGHSQNDPCGLLLGNTMTFLNDDLNLAQTKRPTGFIDAWSSADIDGSISEVSHKYSDPPNSNQPTLPLTLSMSSGNADGRPEEHLEIRLTHTEQDKSGLKSNQPMINWLGEESWMGSTPGGPLAEALYLGVSSNVKSAPNHQYHPSLPYGCSSRTPNTNMQNSSDESSHSHSNNHTHE